MKKYPAAVDKVINAEQRILVFDKLPKRTQNELNRRWNEFKRLNKPAKQALAKFWVLARKHGLLIH